MLLKETMLYVTTLDMLCLCLHTIKPCTCSTTYHPTRQPNSNPQFIMDNLRPSPRVNALLAKISSSFVSAVISSIERFVVSANH